jgi:MoaA/NifB/PqqE/SkfB family radical SAM enzyme
MELISSVDLVISTAGYNMCNEICKVKTPAIMVPLPRHIESQEERVINLEKIGTVINLNRYDANKLSEIVLELYNNREKLQKMKKAFNKIKLDVGNKKAAEEILKLNQEKLPSIASIKLSKHCNNNCIFCSKLEFKLQSEKSIEQIKEELNEMRRKGVKELSLPCNSDTREDLLNIAAYAKWLGFKVTLNTNGRVLSYKDFAEKVAGAVDQFNVYLNGHTAELHDPITKVKGSFEQTIEGIKNLKKMNQDVVIKVVVDKRNYNELEKITRLLDKIKVNKLQFVFLDEHPPLDKVIPPLLKAIDFAERNGIEINFNKYRRLLGVVTGRLFRGPEIVQIDPTNKCNYNCVYCWSYSPLLKSRKSVEWNKQEIEFDFFKRIVDELAKLNVDIISLPGGGEPFMHPRIMDMIEYVKSKGLKLSILTNASLMSKDVVERIVGLGVDHLLVNISCASPETYTKMHPNQKMERFNEIKNNLVYLNELKKRSKMKNPYIKIVNMITNFNYREMPAMVEFAKEIGADFVSFKPTSTLEGTNSLLLSKEQIEEAVNHAKKLLVKMKEEGIDNNLDNFIKLVTQDLSGQYTEDLIRKIGCYTTWYYWRVTADKTFAPCCHAPIHVKIGEDRFEEIWNSPTYKKFRRKIKEHNQKKEKVAYEECKICEHFKKNSEILKELEKHNLLQFLDDRYG